MTREKQQEKPVHDHPFQIQTCTACVISVRKSHSATSWLIITIIICAAAQATLVGGGKIPATHMVALHLASFSPRSEATPSSLSLYHTATPQGRQTNKQTKETPGSLVFFLFSCGWWKVQYTSLSSPLPHRPHIWARGLVDTVEYM